MRALARLAVPFLLALTPVAAMAADAPAAAPVADVTTAAVPASTAAMPANVAPTAGIGQPRGAIDLQPPFTPIAREAQSMVHGVLNPVMFGVAAFVLVLLGVTIVRFRARPGREASRTSHNTLIEVIWTAVPVLILVVIAVPSFRLLANQYSPPKADLTIKAIGHQWYWEYEYPDQGGFSFDSIMLSDTDADKRGSPHLLDVDNRIVVPAGVTVKVLTTAADVIHSFAVPSFWVKMDAVPGRINETWFKVDKPGVYFGQCSELCGTKHGFMPIAVEVVSKEQFAAWVADQQKKNGITPPSAAAAATPAPQGGPAAPAAGATPPAAAPTAAAADAAADSSNPAAVAAPAK